MARDDEEEWQPSKPKPGRLGAELAPAELAPFSVDELERYIAVLRAEISRIEAAIDAKKTHLSGAESLFKR